MLAIDKHNSIVSPGNSKRAFAAALIVGGARARVALKQSPRLSEESGIVCCVCASVCAYERRDRLSETYMEHVAEGR